MERTGEQLHSMKKLRKLFAEKGFQIYTLKGRKHPAEFLAVREDRQMSAFVCRFWRNKYIRVLALECAGGTLQKRERQELKTWVGPILQFLPYTFNPTRYGNNRLWDELTLKVELLASLRPH